MRHLFKRSRSCMFRVNVLYGLRVATSAAIGPKVDLSEAVLQLWLGKYPLNHESVFTYTSLFEASAARASESPGSRRLSIVGLKRSGGFVREGS
jgi:hypothetical protein